MAGLKNADDYQNGERFKGGRLLGLVSLVIGLAATAIFFIIAYFGMFDSVKSEGAGVVQLSKPSEVVNGKTSEFQEIHVIDAESKKVIYDAPAGSEIFVKAGQSVAAGEKLLDLNNFKRKGMAYSWLFAVVFFLSLGVGGMFWTLLHHASNSGWGTVVRRLMENLGLMIPIMFFLSLPLVLLPDFKNSLWEWIPEREAFLEAADLKAQNEVPSYIEAAKGKVAKAEKELNDRKAEKAAEGELKPGAASFYDTKITAAQAELYKLKKEASKSPEEVHKKIAEKEFKHNKALLHVKRNYLNNTFWSIRFVLYALVLGGGIFLLRSFSVRQDKTGDVKLFTRLRGMSCLILLPFAVAWTFLVVDWLMALDYAWFSTMWGVYLFAGAALNSMALLILIMTGLRKAGYLKDVITKEHYHIMGKLMHAFVIFWAYIAFSQFFLIWYANITEETKFFLIRNTGGWNTYTILFLVIGHFFLPFLVLLIRYHKTTVWIISAVCIWNLIMHMLDIYWIIIPERSVSLTGGERHFLPEMVKFDLLALIGVGGIFIFCLLKALGSASLYPCRDPRLDESLNLTN